MTHHRFTRRKDTTVHHLDSLHCRLNHEDRPPQIVSVTPAEAGWRLRTARLDGDGSGSLVFEDHEMFWASVAYCAHGGADATHHGANGHRDVMPAYYDPRPEWPRDPGGFVTVLEVYSDTFCAVHVVPPGARPDDTQLARNLATRLELSADLDPHESDFVARSRDSEKARILADEKGTPS